MQTIKRFLLLFGVNLGIVILLTIIFNIVSTYFWISLWYDNWVLSLFIFSLIFGFIWAIINLMISKWIAKKIYGIQIIKENSSDRKLNAIYNKIVEISNKEWIKVPEIGFWESDEPNAFATGASKNNSLVAFSTGILDNMESNELESIAGHEMAHIVNGDMVTMTLLQWVLNTFVIFLSRFVASIIESYIFRDEESNSNWIIYFIVSLLLEIVFGILASIIAFAYSRHREYRADEWAVKYTSKEDTISAFEKLKILINNMNNFNKDEFSTLKIASSKKSKIMKLFSTHPDIDDRIEHIRSL